jgi:hypothetical protein
MQDLFNRAFERHGVLYSEVPEEDDAECKIIQTAAKLFGIDITLQQANIVWRWHSYDSARAGFLSLPYLQDGWKDHPNIKGRSIRNWTNNPNYPAIQNVFIQFIAEYCIKPEWLEANLIKKED